MRRFLKANIRKPTNSITARKLNVYRALAPNVLQLGEVADFKAHTFNLALTFIRMYNLPNLTTLFRGRMATVLHPH